MPVAALATRWRGIPAHGDRHAVVTDDGLPEQVGRLIVVVAPVRRGSHPSPGRDARRPHGGRSEPVQAGLMKVILVVATMRVNARGAPFTGWTSGRRTEAAYGRGR